MMDEVKPGKNGSSAAEQMKQQFEHESTLFDSQPGIVQRFLEAQASQISDVYIKRQYNIHFSLPDRVILSNSAEVVPVPEGTRDQKVGKISDYLTRRNPHEPLRQRFTELSQTGNPAVAASAELIRFATAHHMIHNLLPSGRNVSYAAAEEDDIPTIPVGEETSPESAITASTDAIAEEGNGEEGRGSLQVPFVPAARRFYLPQWVAFDSNDKLIVNTLSEAEAHIASMQRFLDILFGARTLAPYMVADKEFEKKRYGMLGQLANQGRAMARYQTREIIHTIQDRAKNQSLNRGLSLSLPYFDDQDLKIAPYRFTIIPAGRIMFVPAFVVRAALEERAKVAQDTRFNISTCLHLMNELQMLGEAFESDSD